MLNSPILSIFQHFQAIPLRSPLISLRSKWRLTGFSRRFTPKNPVRLHNPFGELPRWGAKKVLPLNLIALPNGEGCDTRMLLFSHCQNKYTHMWKKNNDGQSLPRVGKVASGASRIGFWRDEKERRRSSQVRRLREHPSAAEKGSQPRLAALGSPFQGKGIAWILPPSYGRRCLEGAEVGWGDAV